MRKQVLAAVLVLCGAASSAQAGGITLLPHRAVYSVDLSSSAPGGGVVGAHGTMSYEFSETCDGWVTENRFAVTYGYAEGAEVDTTTDFITWESKDGLKYRFRMRSTRDGQVTDDIEGTAQLRGKGEAGTAHFTRPDDATMTLPKGTLFPTEHTRHLVEVASKGATSLRRVVFDGSDTQGAFDVNALIGTERRAPAPEIGPQLDSPSWPMRLAFFPLKGDDAEPDFELSADYHSNGVAQTIYQHFRTFSLVGHMTALQQLPRPGCTNIH